MRLSSFIRDLQNAYYRLPLQFRSLPLSNVLYLCYEVQPPGFIADGDKSDTTHVTCPLVCMEIKNFCREGVRLFPAANSFIL